MASVYLKSYATVKYFCVFHPMSELQNCMGYLRCPICGWLKGKGVVSVTIDDNRDDLPSTSSGIRHNDNDGGALGGISEEEKYLLLIHICCDKLLVPHRVEERALETAKLAMERKLVTGIPQPLIAAAAVFCHMPRNNAALQLLSDSTGQNSRAIVATSQLMSGAARNKDSRFR